MENAKVRGNQRKMTFQRRKKPVNALCVDPSAEPTRTSTFFGTVGSPIKMGTAAAGMGRRALKLPQRPLAPVDAPVDSEAATLDVNQKAVFREELRWQQKANQRANQRAEQAHLATPLPDKEQRQQPPPQQLPPDEASVATVRQERGGRRNSTEFLGQHMEPVQQLKLDGAKKAKIPHFLSAWFNAGHEIPPETRWTWKALTSSRPRRSGRPRSRTPR